MCLTLISHQRYTPLPYASRRLTSSIISTGGVVYPIALKWAFEAHGFRNGVLICGLTSSVACGIAAASIDVSASAAQSRNLKAKANATKKFFDFKSIAETKFALLVVGSAFVALGAPRLHSLIPSHPPNALTLQLISGLFTPFFYIVEYATKLTLTSPSALNAYYTVAILNAGGILGRIAPAYLSDKIGHFNLLFPAALLSGLSCVILWMLAKTMEVLMSFAAVYGFFSGAFVSLITPCIVAVSEPSEIGTRIGMLYTIISIP